MASAPGSSGAPPAGVVLIVADREAPVTAAPGASLTRCYAADPASVRGRDAILRGRFPHLLGGMTLPEALAGAGWQSAPSLSSALKAGGRFCSVIEAPADTGASSLRSASGLLEQAGALNDTLVVFTATRGGDEETWSEKSTRVPLLFQWPRRIAGAELDLLASAVDVMPTVLGLCGVPPPDRVQGQDLSPSLLHPGGARPESIYSEGRLGTPQSWRMIVRGLDKLVFTPGLNILRLYNLGQDPGETTDLSNKQSAERKCDELRAIAADWMRRLGDLTDPSGLKRR